jgi:hypothetical protein
MANSNTPIETLAEKAENYGKITAKLVTLQFIQKIADIASTLLMKILLTLVLAMFILSINIGLALWMGALLGKNYCGFFVIAGVYLLLLIVLYNIRGKYIKTPIQTIIITEMIADTLE